MSAASDGIKGTRPSQLRQPQQQRTAVRLCTVNGLLSFRELAALRTNRSGEGRTLPPAALQTACSSGLNLHSERKPEETLIDNTSTTAVDSSANRHAGNNKDAGANIQPSTEALDKNVEASSLLTHDTPSEVKNLATIVSNALSPHDEVNEQMEWKAVESTSEDNVSGKEAKETVTSGAAQRRHEMEDLQEKEQNDANEEPGTPAKATKEKVITRTTATLDDASNERRVESFAAHEGQLSAINYSSSNNCARRQFSKKETMCDNSLRSILGVETSKRAIRPSTAAGIRSALRAFEAAAPPSGTRVTAEESKPALELPTMEPRGTVVINMGANFCSYVLQLDNDERDIEKLRELSAARDLEEEYEMIDMADVNAIGSIPKSGRTERRRSCARESQYALCHSSAIPACVLLAPDLTYHSMGYAAKSFYRGLNYKNAKSWLLFDKLMLSLYESQRLSDISTIKSTSGVSCLLVKVLESSLLALKEQVLKDLNSRQSCNLDEWTLQWVIVVPAVWMPAAKMLVRKAAYKARITDEYNPSRLRMVHELEAIAISCSDIEHSQLIEPNIEGSPWQVVEQHYGGPEHPARKLSLDRTGIQFFLRPGDKFIVAYCSEGNAVEISAFELDNDRKLHELQPTSGGTLGQAAVDTQFELLLCEIFGGDFIRRFKVKRSAAYMDLTAAIRLLHNLDLDYHRSQLCVTIPDDLVNYYRKVEHRTITQAVLRYLQGDAARAIAYDESRRVLLLHATTLKQLLMPTIGCIKRWLSEAVSHPSSVGVGCLFLGGGVAQSRFVQAELLRDLAVPKVVMLPSSTRSFATKGALTLTREPLRVASRKSRLAFGVGILGRTATTHSITRQPIAARHQRTGRVSASDWCLDRFDKFIDVGETVVSGSAVTKCYTPVSLRQQAVVFGIYCSNVRGARFLADPGTVSVGQIRLNLTGEADEKGSRSAQSTPIVSRASSSHNDDARSVAGGGDVTHEIQVTMMLGGTELLLQAADVNCDSGCSRTAFIG